MISKFSDRERENYAENERRSERVEQDMTTQPVTEEGDNEQETGRERQSEKLARQPFKHQR